MIGDSQKVEEIDAQALELAEETYSVGPSASSKLHTEKLKLKQRLLEIQRQETDEEMLKKEIEQELLERRTRYNQMMREKALSQEIVETNFAQQDVDYDSSKKRGMI